MQPVRMWAVAALPAAVTLRAQYQARCAILSADSVSATPANLVSAESNVTRVCPVTGASIRTVAGEIFSKAYVRVLLPQNAIFFS